MIKNKPFDQPAKLYVKFGKMDSLRDLMYEFFHPRKVYYNYIRGERTYLDEECLQLHCDVHKLRSFDDMLTIAQTYYPETTASELFKILITLHPRSKYLMHLGCCSGIQRIRLCYGSMDIVDKFDQYKVLNEKEQYQSQYGWDDLYKLIGIKNREDFENFVKQQEENE